MRSANFVEETTTSIAGTGGNGAITLTAIASVPRFSTVFGTQATTIRYVIEDTVGKRFETGIGSVAANVLTRTRPQVTWDGTTYDDSTPAPIAFGSTPASGNIKVRLSATAESQGVVMPGVNNNALIGAAGIFQEYAITRSLRTNSSGVAGNLVANTIYYWAYKLENAGLLTGLACNIITSGGTGLKLALYAIGSDGLPSAKIVDFNTINTATTGDKIDTATGTWSPAGPCWLVPGWYAIGGICDGAAALRGVPPDHAISRSPFNRGGGYGDSALISIAGASYNTGLPAVASMAGATLRGDNSPLFGPYIGLRVQA